MDNLCHTLVGAALAEAGLKRRSPYGTATLLISANLPDVDALVFFTNTPFGLVPARLDARRACGRVPADCADGRGRTWGPRRLGRRAVSADRGRR